MSGFSEVLLMLVATCGVMALAVAFGPGDREDAARQHTQGCGVPPLVDDSELSSSVPSPQASLEERTGSPRVGSAGVALVRVAGPTSPVRAGYPTPDEDEIGQVAA